jgi:DNA repair protein RadA/Sms
LIEIQGLAAKAGYGTPQRVSTGYDARRLALLLAVLDKRAGLSFSQLDVFLNVVGGVRMQEPAGDLAVASALASSVYDKPVDTSAIFLGEVGLGGEIRPVSQAERRLGEEAKMGMTTAHMASGGSKRPALNQVIGVRTVGDLFGQLFNVRRKREGEAGSDRRAGSFRIPVPATFFPLPASRLPLPA